MARYVHYRCPDCAGTFKHLHVLSDDPPPDRCPLCNSWVSGDEPPEEVFVPQAPAIRKSIYAKSIEQTYRATEAASIERANEAASILESEFARQPRDRDFESGLLEVTQREQVATLRSELKITDMKDPMQMREGDNAVSGTPTPTAVKGASFQDLSGGQHIPGGPSNAPFISNATQDHNARAHAMIRAGRLNPS